jgi:hypothetical protein
MQDLSVELPLLRPNIDKNSPLWQAAQQNRKGRTSSLYQYFHGNKDRFEAYQTA